MPSVPKPYLFCVFALAAFKVCGQVAQPQTSWKGKVKTVKISEIKYWRYDEKRERQPLTKAEFRLLEKNEDRADDRKIHKLEKLQSTIEYDQEGYPVKVIQNENTYLNEYDAQHHLIKQSWYKNPKETETFKIITWTYDAQSHLIHKEINGNTVLDRSYNSAGQLLTETIPESEWQSGKIQNTYNSKGELVKVLRRGTGKNIFNSYTFDRSAPLKTVKTSFEENGDIDRKDMLVEDTVHHIKAYYRYYGYSSELTKYDSTCYNEKGQFVKRSGLAFGKYETETCTYDEQGFMVTNEGQTFEAGDTIPYISSKTFFPGTNITHTLVYGKPGSKTSITYDAWGNKLLEITEKYGVVTTKEYYEGAAIVSKISAKGNKDRYIYMKEYDRHDNLRKNIELKNDLISTGTEIEITYY